MKLLSLSSDALRRALDAAYETRLLNGRVLLVFLRHPGCIFTSTALTALGQARKEIESFGVTIVLVNLEPDPGCAAAQASKFGLDGVVMISDLERKIYQAAGMDRAGVLQVISPRVIWSGMKAFFGGHRQTSMKADPRQLAGVALLDNGNLITSQSCSNVAEVPDYLQLVKSTFSLP